jgi:hypothetical protein
MPFWEGAGPQTQDLSRNKNNGILINGVTWADNSLSFDGINDYVDCGNDASLDITGEITIEAWVKLYDAGSYPTIVGKSWWDYNYLFEFVTDTRKVGFWYTGIGGNWRSANTAVPLDTWVHLAVVYSGTSGQFYYNGVPDGSFTGDSGLPSTPSNKVYIGRRPEDGDMKYPINGLIDEVVIYNIALTATEIMERYLFPFAMFQQLNLARYVSIVGGLHRYHELSGLGSMGSLNYNPMG